MSPFLTIAETAELARISPKTLRNLMAAGVLLEGVHYVRPKGLAPRFKRDAVLAWLDPPRLATPDTEPIPMAAAQRRASERLRVAV